MRFEWDEDKDQSNRQKHDGIDFNLASRVFEDENALVFQDRVRDSEQRWHAIGRVHGIVLLVVVHTYKEASDGEEIIRIISARQAEKHEIRRYFRQTPQ